MQRKGLAVGLLTSLLGACTAAADDSTGSCGPGDSATDLPTGGNGPTPSCAERSETYSADDAFPLDPGAQDPGLSQCAPRCGAAKRSFDGFYSSDALPAGICSPCEVPCSMAAHEVCPCPTNRGPVSIYQCSCNNEKWTCVIVSRGASTCSAFNADGGTSSCPGEGGPDEDASADRVEGGETGQPEDASVNDAYEDASSSADARGDHDGGHLADGSTHDAGNLCARTGSMATCFDNCASDEVCFTQVICGPLADGGTTCSVGPGTVGDDRCHRACDSSSACSTGEECVRYPFFGCSDFNGGPSGRGICCPAGGCQ